MPVAIAESGLSDLIAYSGRAIDIACGLGAQTLWLATRGLHVMALDVSAQAVERVGAAAHVAGVADRVHAVASDLDGGLPTFPPASGGPATSDLADTSGVDVIVCQRFWAPHLYDPIVDRLTPSGIAVITVLSSVGAQRPGEFHAPAGELLTNFTSERTEVLWHREGHGEASIVFRRAPSASGGSARAVCQQHVAQ